MLTREQIIAKLTMLKRMDYYFYDDGDGYYDYGMEPGEYGDYYRRDDILDIIKEAESE